MSKEVADIFSHFANLQKLKVSRKVLKLFLQLKQRFEDLSVIYWLGQNTLNSIIYQLGQKAIILIQ